MKRIGGEHVNEKSEPRSLRVQKRTRTRSLAIVFALTILVGGAALLFGAHAPSKAESKGTLYIVTSPPQSPSGGRVALNNRLALQPRADRLRHRLGQRFLSAGQEVSSLVGTLNINGRSVPISILRRQDGGGESISIQL